MNSSAARNPLLDRGRTLTVSVDGQSATTDAESTVMVVDGHQIFRDGVRNLLAEQGIVVVGEAGDAAEAVALAADAKPDIALMDLDLPGASGIEATNRIRLVSPVTRVLMLTVSAQEDDVYDALRAGACGYLLKDAPAEEIVAGIRAAAAGQSLLAPRVAALLLERFRESLPAMNLPDDVVPQLTAREQEVLSLIAAGKENAEIADSLVISQHTVKNHVSSILAKLEVENRIQAAVYAVRQRLV
jgi:DNA-binding NarL/FixJ family response regulator